MALTRFALSRHEICDRSNLCGRPLALTIFDIIPDSRQQIWGRYTTGKDKKTFTVLSQPIIRCF